MKVTRVPGYQPQTATTTYGVGGVGKGILSCGEPWHGMERDGEHRKDWYPLRTRCRADEGSTVRQPIEMHEKHESEVTRRDRTKRRARALKRPRAQSFLEP